jgi:condensin complex subunit 2
MPRVVNAPRASGRSKQHAAPLSQSPLKYDGEFLRQLRTLLTVPSNRLPLNDDVQEKAVRLQSRQALHDLQLNQIKAAASPMRKLDSYNRAASSSPRTPRGSSGGKGKEKENEGVQAVGGAIVTPMKRVPILANFEEWMKMATDNVRKFLVGGSDADRV